MSRDHSDVCASSCDVAPGGVAAVVSTGDSLHLPGARLRVHWPTLHLTRRSPPRAGATAAAADVRVARPPIHWILLVDVSASVQEFRPALVAAVTAFLASGMPTTDAVSVALFNHKVSPVLAMTPWGALTPRTIAALADRILPHGGTNLLAALEWGHEQAAATAAAFDPHLLLLSDGEQTQPPLPPTADGCAAAIEARLRGKGLGAFPVAQLLVGRVLESFFACLMRFTTSRSAKCNTAVESIAQVLGEVTFFHEAMLLRHLRVARCGRRVSVRLRHPHMTVQFDTADGQRQRLGRIIERDAPDDAADDAASGDEAKAHSGDDDTAELQVVAQCWLPSQPQAAWTLRLPAAARGDGAPLTWDTCRWVVYHLRDAGLPAAAPAAAHDEFFAAMAAQVAALEARDDDVDAKAEQAAMLATLTAAHKRLTARGADMLLSPVAPPSSLDACRRERSVSCADLRPSAAAQSVGRAVSSAAATAIIAVEAPGGPLDWLPSPIAPRASTLSPLPWPVTLTPPPMPPDDDDDDDDAVVATSRDCRQGTGTNVEGRR